MTDEKVPLSKYSLWGFSFKDFLELMGDRSFLKSQQTQQKPNKGSYLTVCHEEEHYFIYIFYNKLSGEIVVVHLF
jgi:hypothetical protein